LRISINANKQPIMEKQYFIKDSIISSSKSEIIEYMKDNNLSELVVFEAKNIKVDQYFYCKLYGMAERDNMTCGVKWCNKYEPRNGKSGCCKQIGFLFETGKEITIINKNHVERSGK